jgi:hypothetical protein
MATESERITRLEAVQEQTIARLNDLNANLSALRTDMNAFRSEFNTRFNTQMQITIAMWVTTMLAVLGTLAAVLVRG